MATKKTTKKIFILTRYDDDTSEIVVNGHHKTFQEAFDNAEEGNDIYEVVAIHEAAKNLKPVKKSFEDYTG